MPSETYNCVEKLHRSGGANADWRGYCQKGSYNFFYNTSEDEAEAAAIANWFSQKLFPFRSLPNPDVEPIAPDFVKFESFYYGHGRYKQKRFVSGPMLRIPVKRIGAFIGRKGAGMKEISANSKVFCLVDPFDFHYRAKRHRIDMSKMSDHTVLHFTHWKMELKMECFQRAIVYLQKFSKCSTFVVLIPMLWNPEQFVLDQLDKKDFQIQISDTECEYMPGFKTCEFAFSPRDPNAPFSISYTESKALQRLCEDMWSGSHSLEAFDRRIDAWEQSEK